MPRNLFPEFLEVDVTLVVVIGLRGPNNALSLRIIECAS